MFWNISSACTTTKSIPCRRPQFSRYFKKSLRIEWFLNARLTRGHRPRNSMPAMLDMFIRTFADARLFCNERTFLSFFIMCYYTTWLILIVNDCRWFMFSEYWHFASPFSKAVEWIWPLLHWNLENLSELLRPHRPEFAPLTYIRITAWTSKASRKKWWVCVRSPSQPGAQPLSGPRCNETPMAVVGRLRVVWFLLFLLPM